MTQPVVLTDEEIYLIRRALIDAYHSNTYLADEKELAVSLLDDLPNID